MKIVIPEDLKLDASVEGPDPEKPPTPKIIIAPPQDIVIPSAAVDAQQLDHGLSSDNDNEEDALEAALKSQNI